MLYYEGTIAGSDTNNVETLWSSVGGGRHNQILAPNALFGTIPGGRELIAAAYGQTIVGVYNDTAFSRSKESDFLTQPIPTPRGDDPFFVVGNGKPGSRSNAAVISNNGHLTLTDVNGSGGATPNGSGNPSPRPAYKGSTYLDNVIYAWGDVQPQVNPPSNVVVNSDFGVLKVQRIAVGVYQIWLNVQDPTTRTSLTLNSASITVTLVDNSTDTTYGTCGMVTTSRIGIPGANQFIVKTYAGGDLCILSDRPFMFKVCGRP